MDTVLFLQLLYRIEANTPSAKKLMDGVCTWGTTNKSVNSTFNENIKIPQVGTAQSRWNVSGRSKHRDREFSDSFVQNLIGQEIYQSWHHISFSHKKWLKLNWTQNINSLMWTSKLSTFMQPTTMWSFKEFGFILRELSRCLRFDIHL